jgi:hypothetical protein
MRLVGDAGSHTIGSIKNNEWESDKYALYDYESTDWIPNEPMVP